MIEFCCPTCDTDLEVTNDHQGQKVVCPTCRQRILVAQPPPNKTKLSGQAREQESRRVATPAFCRNCGNQVSKKALACLSCGVVPSNGDQYCPGCGAETNPAAVICLKCGIGLSAGKRGQAASGGGRILPSDPPKDPVLMCVLSILLVGLGQILLGQIGKGIVMLIGGIVLITISGCLLAPIIWIAVGIDAYMIANKLKQGNSVGEWEFF